ncbi:MAG: DUF87 domain-containing protein [Thermoproteota archaeon]|nr:DUF87 domain-containing protein [Thermoproteota archaeon]
MQLYKKQGNTVQILSFPDENIEKGDYLLIRNPNSNKALIVQVIDVQFANIPGVLEELLRNSNHNSQIQGEDLDPLEISPYITLIQDSRLLIGKIRAALDSQKLINNSSWLPSRSRSEIQKISVTSLIDLVKASNNLPVHLGETRKSSPFIIDVQSLDGRLNIVTGKKETGKSHLSKLLVLALIHYGATVVIFDLNGEYTSLGYASNGEKNEYYEKVHVLTPGQNFRVTLTQVKLHVMLKVLLHALHLPGTSAREFQRIWGFLQRQNALTLRDLGGALKNWRCNQHIRDALYSRYYTLLNSGFFTDSPSESTNLTNCLYKTRKNGGAVVVNLSDVSSINRRIVVEYMLGKLVELLTSWRLRAVFLFAEEAHLYLRETHWDDIVTRMRHFGVFTTFVTNQPDTLRGNIYRQADNIFLFNFTNEHDLETVSQAARVDAETVKSIARDLPPRHCLVLGKVVKDFPIVVKVRSLDVQTMGETRLFFSQEN